MLKPDAVQRNLVGELISRLEKKGLKICALKMLSISRELAERHYEEHKKPLLRIGKLYYFGAGGGHGV